MHGGAIVAETMEQVSVVGLLGPQDPIPPTDELEALRQAFIASDGGRATVRVMNALRWTPGIPSRSRRAMQLVYRRIQPRSHSPDHGRAP